MGCRAAWTGAGRLGFAGNEWDAAVVLRRRATDNGSQDKQLVKQWLIQNAMDNGIDMIRRIFQCLASVKMRSSGFGKFWLA